MTNNPLKQEGHTYKVSVTHKCVPVFNTEPIADRTKMRTLVKLLLEKFPRKEQYTIIVRMVCPSGYIRPMDEAEYLDVQDRTPGPDPLSLAKCDYCGRMYPKGYSDICCADCMKKEGFLD